MFSTPATQRLKAKMQEISALALLQHPLDRDHDPRLVFGHVVELAVSRVYQISVEELLAPSRGPAPTALARQVAMYLARVVGGLRFDDVGRVFRRDRTTVAHACTVIENRRDDPVFDMTLDRLENMIKHIVQRMFPSAVVPGGALNAFSVVRI